MGASVSEEIDKVKEKTSFANFCCKIPNFNCKQCCTIDYLPIHYFIR